MLPFYVDRLSPMTSFGVSPTSPSDYGPVVWWIDLTTVSVFNILVYIYSYRRYCARDEHQQRLKECAGIYVVACAIRSIWPRIDVERVCFWDLEALQTTLVGRSLATVAEISYTYQITTVAAQIAHDLGLEKRRRLIEALHWPLVFAQTFCWMGVTTQRQVWHCLEESLWMTVIGTIGFTCLTMIPHTWPRACWDAKIFLNIMAGMAIPFVWFMATTDVPMYYARYLRDEAQGVKYNTVLEGIYSAGYCHSVSRSMDVWAEELPWMGAYFSAAVWFSMFMMRAPRVPPPGGVGYELLTNDATSVSGSPINGVLAHGQYIMIPKEVLADLQSSQTAVRATG
jgi:hypothetical protein